MYFFGQIEQYLFVCFHFHFRHHLLQFSISVRLNWPSLALILQLQCCNQSTLFPPGWSWTSRSWITCMLLLESNRKGSVSHCLPGSRNSHPQDLSLALLNWRCPYTSRVNHFLLVKHPHHSELFGVSYSILPSSTTWFLLTKHLCCLVPPRVNQSTLLGSSLGSCKVSVSSHTLENRLIDPSLLDNSLPSGETSQSLLDHCYGTQGSDNSSSESSESTSESDPCDEIETEGWGATNSRWVAHPGMFHSSSWYLLKSSLQVFPRNFSQTFLFIILPLLLITNSNFLEMRMMKVHGTTSITQNPR